jgi:hypothetical protein
MAKSVNNDVLDAALNVVKNSGTRLAICSAEPTTYTQAMTTYALAVATIDSTDFTGPVDGDTSGRKLTVTAQSGVSITVSGTANHVAVCDQATSRLLYVTTCTAQALTSGNTVNTPAWDIELADPA